MPIITGCRTVQIGTICLPPPPLYTTPPRTLPFACTHACAPRRTVRRVSSLARARAKEAKELARDRILNPDKYKRVHRYMRG